MGRETQTGWGIPPVVALWSNRHKWVLALSRGLMYVAVGMKRRWPVVLSLLALLTAAGCDPQGLESAGPKDLDGGDGGAAPGTEIDPVAAPGEISGPTDESVDVALPGFGAIDGDCDVLEATDLVRGAPAVTLFNELILPDRAFEARELSPGGQRILADDNAGGSSKDSEIFAYEMLYRCEGASLVHTENEVEYDRGGSKTDFTVDLEGQRIGVSVVRAFKYDGVYTAGDAAEKLEEKLRDILESTSNVSSVHRWEKQILSVVVERQESMAIVADALDRMGADVRADTVVAVTLTSGHDAFIYR
ncbi:MAG: hypothetical protein AAGA56_12965 [Myxococcota bacterium]